jgi:DNA (cytosine-5)-methyltransferase 1
VTATVLFAGAGGSSLGLHDAGYDVVGYEYWQRAVDTHLANGMACHLHDLSDPTLDDAIAPCDLLWASPPCQPFSAAGDGEGENDDRDGFPWTLRIIARLLPSVVIIENVKGLTFDKHADYFGGVLRSLGDLGYEWDWKVLNSADYGVPQTRERCFIVARRDGGRIVWPAPTHTPGDSLFLKPWVTMAEALGWGMTERPFGAVAISSPTGGPRMDGCGGSGARAALVAERDAGRWVLRPFWNKSDRHPDRDPHADPAPTLPANCTDWHWAAPNETIRLIIGVRKLMGDGMVERHGERPMRTVDEPSFAVRAQGGGRDPSGFVKVYADDPDAWPHHRPATTIAGDTRVFQPGGYHEPGEQSANAIRLTIAELARLQGFPDSFVWTSTKTDQARQVGNAVPPIMAQVLAEANRPVTP